MGDLEELAALDVQLIGVASEETALRLRLGQVLETMHRLGHCSALGFSSLGAYALERCDRSVRWVEAARCLARRLEELPSLRRTTAAGQISWSMAELLAREATTGDELEWIALARGHTLREMRQIVNQRRSRNARCRCSECGSPGCGSPGCGSPGCGSPGCGSAEHRNTECSSCGTSAAKGSSTAIDEGPLPSEPARRAPESDGEDECTLRCRLNREDFWLFEATRALLERLGTQGGDDQAEALLAEGQATLLAALPKGALNIDGAEFFARQEPPGCEAFCGPQTEAEGAAELHLHCLFQALKKPVSEAPTEESVRSNIALEAAIGTSSLAGRTARELDDLIRSLSRSLAEHEFVFARLLLEFHRRNGWRELGHATETQYARERLGLSRSSLLARRALAGLLETLPVVANALRTGRIGVEAACQIVRVAVPGTEVAWVERAQRRTVKHLREEVVAALTAVRVSGEVHCPPPLDSELGKFQDLERAVLRGDLWREPLETKANAEPLERLEGQQLEPHGTEPQDIGPPSGQRRAWRTMLSSLGAWLTRGIRLSAVNESASPRAAGPNTGSHSQTSHVRRAASAGCVEVRLRVSTATRAWWRALEVQARRWLPRGVSWMRFLCLAMWRDWNHLLGVDVAYGGIYLRDRCRCSSPVCNRRDVTPHHLRFRSAGGDDSEANLTALCSWCHLCGVHGGSIRAHGAAPLIRWDLGPALAPCLSVYGRERLA